MKIRRGILAATIALSAFAASTTAQAAPPPGNGCKGSKEPHPTTFFVAEATASGHDPVAAQQTDANNNNVVCVNPKHPNDSDRYFRGARDDDCSVVPCSGGSLKF